MFYPPSRSIAHWQQTLQGIAIAIVLSLVFLLTPAIAQSASRAPVVLDGQPIFQLSNAGDYSASERAAIVNARLRELVQSPESFQLQVVERNQLPTILVNGRYLITVTERDSLLGNDSWEQARLWAQQIEAAVRQGQYARSPKYIRNALLLAGGILAIALFLHWLLGRLWQRYLRPGVRALFPPAEPGGEPELPRAANLLISSLLVTTRAGLWIGVALYLTNLFPLTRHWTYRIIDILIASFTSPILTLGNSGYSVTNLLFLMVMLFCLIIASKTVTDLLRSRVLNITGVNRGAQEAITIIVRYSLIFIGTLVLLQVWGLDISSLAILASALSVGIGFGLQDIAKNFGSGLVLVFERPIQVGDFVEVGEFQGTVERIGARSTLIRTLDQVSIIVPNSRFLAQEVINWSHDNPISRLHLPVGVAYQSDIQLVRSTLLEAAKDHPWVLSTPKPQVFMKGFGDNSISFELLVWTAEPSKQLPLKSDLYFRIEELFRERQIQVPFPQRDLYLKTDRLPIEFSPQLQEFLQHWKPSSNGHSSEVGERSSSS